MRRAAIFTMVLALSALGLGGCRSAGSGATAFTISAGSYGATFDAAKEAVRRLGFGFDRVDARGGVIETNAVSTAGLATPWTKTEASFYQEVDSFLHRDERRVIVSFETVALAPVDDPAGVDFRSVKGDLICSVRAIKTRLFRPGLGLSPAAIRLSSVQSGRDRASRAGKPPRAIERFIGEDEALARLLAGRILEKTLRSGPQATAAAESVEHGSGGVAAAGASESRGSDG